MMQTVQSSEDLDLPIDVGLLRDVLLRGGAVRAWVFGSYARGDQGPDRDLDILIEMDPRRSGWDLAGLLVELADLVPVEVDATTRISRHFEEFIEPELVPIL